MHQSSSRINGEECDPREISASFDTAVRPFASHAPSDLVRKGATSAAAFFPRAA
jgi:hypothetical protein